MTSQFLSELRNLCLAPLTHPIDEWLEHKAGARVTHVHRTRVTQPDSRRKSFPARA